MKKPLNPVHLKHYCNFTALLGQEVEALFAVRKLVFLQILTARICRIWFLLHHTEAGQPLDTAGSHDIVQLDSHHHPTVQIVQQVVPLKSRQNHINYDVSEIRGVIEKFVSFSDTEKSTDFMKIS